MTTSAIKWSLEDYHRMIEAGILHERHVELIKGEIVEMAPEGEIHAYSSHEAGEYLSDLLGRRASVRQAKPITLPNDSEPEPDLAIVQRIGREYRLHHPYPENIFWLVEYSQSSLSKNLETKSSVYAEVGISEYWVIDLKQLHLVVFRSPQNGKYTSKSTFVSGTIQPIAFSDVVVSVSSILNT